MAFSIAPIVENARRLAADYRFDSYTVVRATSTSDSAGGASTTTSVVEAGTCVLTAGATRPDERAVADRAQSSAPYVIRNLPYNTVLRATDTVVIGGRTFEILGVLRAEAVNVAVTAVAEERL
jgi:hypothetical protein